ncbi:hypothetical protein MTF65_13945 [Streptomyces sp. APSN-46.1]|uniref:hypothetical protein n=1 Tax=Streptomyces sp. APSN-46.1 TaxID=2929049 RepID=UPI001FB3E920|nr:hypothetical protein [Streptomyces sp. APSN-46.1]MCJ1678431.1 hypothetical protein [Streptomyces sp. APSN-46.1]
MGSAFADSPTVPTVPPATSAGPTPQVTPPIGLVRAFVTAVKLADGSVAKGGQPNGTVTSWLEAESSVRITMPDGRIAKLIDGSNGNVLARIDLTGSA